MDVFRVCRGNTPRVGPIRPGCGLIIWKPSQIDVAGVESLAWRELRKLLYFAFLQIFESHFVRKKCRQRFREMRLATKWRRGRRAACIAQGVERSGSLILRSMGRNAIDNWFCQDLT